jgi:hypothetical protein
MEAMMETRTDLMMTREDWNHAELRLARRSWRSPLGLGAVLISIGIMAVLLRVAILGFPADFNVLLISMGTTALMLRFALLGF